jgi:DNA-binding CsgD family transcriptional regulator
LPVNALCEMFQLTQAQARVCAALARGEAAEHIAADLGVAVNTIRSHIKLAMERLGVNRQSELVRHLGAALPALITAGPR